MKNSTKRRLLALLLSLVMVLTLAPTALLAETADRKNPETFLSTNNTEEDGEDKNTDPSVITKASLKGEGLGFISDEQYEITLEPNTSEARGLPITVDVEPNTNEAKAVKFKWQSSNSDVVSVSESTDDNAHSGTIFGRAPGKATVTITAGEKTCTIDVTVSGIKLSDTVAAGLEVQENQSITLGLEEDFTLFGNAKNGTLSVSVVNNKTNVNARVSGGAVVIEGRQEGDVTIELKATATGHTYTAEFNVKVTSNVAEINWDTGVSPTVPLRFSALESLINQKCQEMTGDKLASVVGLTVSTVQGTIYQGYKSPDNTGAGAGSSLTYYASGAARGPYISDLTFVPKPDFAGEKAVISFTGTAANGRTFKGKINVTLADAKNEDVTLTTRADVPLKLKSEDFAKVCQEQTGASLDYVIFTLPNSTQGVLYRDYKNELDYAARVTALEQINRKGLDDITFVPARDWVGSVTISYTGYSTTGLKYNGALVIKVERTLDQSIQYQDYGAGKITFRGSDFDAYCEAMTHYPMATWSTVSFTLPSASQGVLYRTSNTVPGNTLAGGDPVTLSGLDYVTFLAADGFDGVVRIPFTGVDRYGTAFSGTVELHIQAVSASAQGDIQYACQPNQSVKLQVADFANLCQSVTGARLYYVTFQSLPDHNQGSLFYNRTSSGAIGTRTTTAVKYYNSATPYLNNVSFWAGESFQRVEIPFTLAAVSGETFTGLMVISTGEGAAGSGRAGAVTYTTSGQQPVTFSGAHFDAACRQATNSALNYLKLNLPSASQGILYYNYRDGATNNTAFDANTTLHLSGEVSVGKVTFVPTKGFSGVATMSFTATAINGATYQGTVQVTVRAGSAYGSVVHYVTGGAPVRFQSADLSSASGIGEPTSIRFTGVPSASQGRIFYQYTSPTQYSWLGNTSTEYSITGDPSVGDLLFIPKAGYQGTVTIPYTATAADGTSAAGSVEIMVALPGVSQYFDDMDGYSGQIKSAVDYLSSQGVVNGTSERTYSPNMSIRRGDFCLMLSRAFKFNVSGIGQQFSDVASDAYYAQAVHEMYAMGVVNGMGDGSFQPNATITRQDAAVMVRRALDKAGLTLADGSDEAALAMYTDRGSVSDYAQAALGSLVRTGVFPAAGDALSPRTALTRADMALLLHRAVTNFI